MLPGMTEIPHGFGQRTSTVRSRTHTDTHIHPAANTLAEVCSLFLWRAVLCISAAIVF